MSSFVVDFFQEKSGVKNRRKLQGSSAIHLSGAKSDFAVQAYLKKIYPNSDIIINNVEWK